MDNIVGIGDNLIFTDNDDNDMEMMFEELEFQHDMEWMEKKGKIYPLVYDNDDFRQVVDGFKSLDSDTAKNAIVNKAREIIDTLSVCAGMSDGVKKEIAEDVYMLEEFTA